MVEATVNDSIKKLHKGGFGGIWLILKTRGTFLKWYYLLGYFFCFASTLWVAINKEKSFEVLTKFNDITLSVFPSLCGFSLSGLAIIIAFGNLELMKKAIKLDRFNIYQSGIAIIAGNIILQLGALLVSIVIKFVSESGIFDIPWNSHYHLKSLINILAFLFESLLSVTAIIMTFFVVFNLFTFGQLYSLFNTINKRNEMSNDTQNKN